MSTKLKDWGKYSAALRGRKWGVVLWCVKLCAKRYEEMCCVRRVAFGIRHVPSVIQMAGNQKASKVCSYNRNSQENPNCSMT